MQLSLWLPKPLWTQHEQAKPPLAASYIVQHDRGSNTIIPETAHLIIDQTHSFRCVVKPSSEADRPSQL